MGYHRAGFTEIVGVDIKPMPRYPFTFVQGDALEYIAAHGVEFDAIHASPPCQAYSSLRHLPWLKGKTWPDLLQPTLDALEASGRPWVAENVERAPLTGVVLCGRQFDLPIYRHRVFASDVFMLQPEHLTHTVVIGRGRHVNDRRKGTLNANSARGAWGKQTVVTVCGNQVSKTEAERALGIDWMSKYELTQAIPPAYTEFIGKQLIAYLHRRAS